MMGEIGLGEEVGVGQKYIRGQLLGNGGFAKCYLMVQCSTQQKFAGKVIRRRELRDKASRAKVLQEIQIHKTTDHPHIVKLVEHFELEGEMYIIMELCQNNSLKEFQRARIRITQFEAKCYLLQLIDGLEYLHSKGIVHRDIKLGNVFLNNRMQVKIGDFGLSTKLKSIRERRFTTCGTPNYIAPEILAETGHGFEVDVWALGIMLYALLLGRPPFESDTVDETYRRIKSNQYDFPKQIPLSTEGKQLIKILLDPNPKTRITIQQLKIHPFLANQNIPAVMPAYTISLPPQSNFLRQYVSEQHIKLAVYPRKISALTGMPEEANSNSNTNLRIHKHKLNRVLSCDKNIFKLSMDAKSPSQDHSQLNRGVIFNSQMRLHLRDTLPAVPIPTLPIEADTYQDDGNEVICYYDMASKYGIGYLLSNGSCGVIFNDQTSLTRLANRSYLYHNGTVSRMPQLSKELDKKGDILRLCSDKLGGYKEKNVLIAFESAVYAKKFVKNRDLLVVKLSNGILQFFWSCDCVTVRGYKWVKWRIGREEGEGSLSSRVFPPPVEGRMAKVREFLQQHSQKRKGMQSDR